MLILIVMYRFSVLHLDFEKLYWIEQSGKIEITKLSLTFANTYNFPLILLIIHNVFINIWFAQTTHKNDVSRFSKLLSLQIYLMINAIHQGAQTWTVDDLP